MPNIYSKAGSVVGAGTNMAWTTVLWLSGGIGALWGPSDAAGIRNAGNNPAWAVSGLATGLACFGILHAANLYNATFCEKPQLAKETFSGAFFATIPNAFPELRAQFCTPQELLTEPILDP